MKKDKRGYINGSGRENKKKKRQKGKSSPALLRRGLVCMRTAPTTNGVMSELELARTFPHLSPSQATETRARSTLPLLAPKLHFTSRLDPALADRLKLTAFAMQLYLLLDFNAELGCFSGALGCLPSRVSLVASHTHPLDHGASDSDP